MRASSIESCSSSSSSSPSSSSIDDEALFHSFALSICPHISRINLQGGRVELLLEGCFSLRERGAREREKRFHIISLNLL